MRYRVIDYKVEVNATTIFIYLKYDGRLDIPAANSDGGWCITYNAEEENYTEQVNFARDVIQSIRLVADETRNGLILMSTGMKDVMFGSIYASSDARYDFCLRISKSKLIEAADGDEEDITAIATVSATDMFTVEVDWGDHVKESSISQYIESIMGGVKGVDYAIQDVLAGYRRQQAFAFGDDFIPDERDVNIFPKVGDVLLFGFDAQHEGMDLYVTTDYDKDAYERGDIWTALEDDSDRISQFITVANVERDSLWRVKEVLEDDGNNHILYIYEPVNLGVSARELQERLRSMQGTSSVANLTTLRTDIRQGLTNQQLILSKLGEISGKLPTLEIATNDEVDQMISNIINPIQR